jgi:hypothetical protein
MARESEQLEQEADQARARLASTLEDLRARTTPGEVVDSFLDYAREGSGAEFLSNLGREICENSLLLLLIGIGIAWLMVASSRSARTMLASTADSAAKKAGEIGTVTTRVVNRTSEWGQTPTQRRLTAESIALGQEAVQPEGHWEHTRTREVDRERG